MKRPTNSATAIAILVAVATGTASNPSAAALQARPEPTTLSRPHPDTNSRPDVAGTIARGVARSRSADEIAQALRPLGVSRLRIHSVERDTAEHSPALDPGIFTVRSMWADWYANGKKFVAFYGFWDFRNSFIGSGAPYDGAAMALSGFGSKCWRNVDTGVVVQDETGRHHDLGWLKSSSHQRSVFGVHDRTRAFHLLNDMGMAWIEMRKDKAGSTCDGRKSGTFYYEHNQGGNGGWSASVSLRVFSISYSGSGGLRLQKASKISYYN